MADWIEWSGGECPVPLGTLIQTRFRHETPANFDAVVLTADGYIWGHDDDPCDIVAYRVVERAK